MVFLEFADALTNWVISVGSSVNDLPGTVAFGLGLFTWFTVEQILRRVLAGLRWIILIGALGAMGLSVPYVARLVATAMPPPTASVENESNG